MTPAGHALLDFIGAGTAEPYALAPEGAEALQLIFAISEVTGDLQANVDEALLLAYFLEGRGQSPSTARTIRTAIASCPAALALVGGSAKPADLVRRGKRVAKSALKARRTSR